MLLSKALRFAAIRHGTQKVPGIGTPYMEHVVRVAALSFAAAVAEGLDGVLAAVIGLLHDTVEDTDATVEDIRSSFGDKVADGVAALTKPSGMGKEKAMEISVAAIKAAGPETRIVKLADRTVNMDPPPASWGRAKAEMYLLEAGYILEQLGEASSMLSSMLSQRMAAYRPGVTA